MKSKGNPRSIKDSEAKAYIEQTTINLLTSIEDAEICMPILACNKEHTLIIVIGNIIGIDSNKEEITVSYVNNEEKKDICTIYLKDSTLDIFEFIGF